MNYRIEISPQARQEISLLPGHVRAQAIQLIDELRQNPRPARAKELKERESIDRIWLAGHWRIVYQVGDEQIIVLILRVRRKADIDYPSV